MLFQIANAFIPALAPWARWDLKVSRAFKACRDWQVSQDPRDARVEADSRDRKVLSTMFVFAKMSFVTFRQSPLTNVAI